jgi:hypothetical protein
VDVVDDEITSRRSRAVIHHLAPRPASPLVEHDVTHDAHAPCRRVEDAVGLGTLRVADENPWRAPVVELADVVELLDEGQAAEDAKVAHRGLAPMPSLVWRLAVEGLGGGAVEQLDSSHHRLTPVDRRHPSLLEEGTGGGHHRLVAALDDAFLLRSVRREKWRWIPSSAQYAANSAVVNSPPLSVRRTQSLRPHSASTAA